MNVIFRPLRRRLQSFVVPTLAVLAVLVFSMASLHFYNLYEIRTANDAITHSHLLELHLERLFSSTKDAENNQRSYLITEHKNYLNLYENAVTRSGQLLNQIKDLAKTDPIQLQEVVKLKQLVDTELDLLAFEVELRKSTGFEAAGKEILASDLRRFSIEQLHDHIDRMQLREKTLLEILKNNLEVSQFHSKLTTLLAAAITLLTVLFALWNYRRDLAYRVSASTALAQQEEHLRITLNSIAEGVIVTDQQGRILLFNPVAQRFMECSEGYVNRKIDEILTIVNEHTNEPIPSLVEQVLETGSATRRGYQSLLISSTGRVIAIEDSAAPCYNRKGELFAVILVFRDMGEQRTIEQRFRAAFSMAGVGIAITDLKGSYLHINQAYSAITEYQEDELRLMDILSITHPENKEQNRQQINNLLERKSPSFTVEKRYITKSGLLIWLRDSFSMLPDIDGTPLNLMVISENITEQKSAQLALSNRETRLHLAVESTGIGIFEWDLKDDVAMWENAHIFNIFGLKTTDTPFNKKTFLEKVIHPEDAVRFNADLNNALNTGTLFHTCCRIYRSNDKVLRWIEFFARFYPHPNQKIPVKLIGTVRDVTADRNSKEELRAANRGKNEFLAMLAHELRNPLTPIRNAAEVIHEVIRLNDKEQTKSILWAHGVIDRQTRHLTRLVDDLLDISRISTGKIILDLKAVNLISILEESIEMTQPLLKIRNHQIDKFIDNDELILKGDPVRLAQIFGNLLNNAAKYTNNEGRIQIQVTKKLEMVEISIKDNGIGMPEHFIPRVFELFAQADRSLARSEGGLGIGLALVHRLVLSHGGSIQASSAGLNKGSCFTVILPLLNDNLIKTEITKFQSTSNKKFNILVVDDNTDSAESLSTLLSLFGHKVHIAHDGFTAISSAARIAPEVVLLDIGLPGMDGYEVARLLRQDSITKTALIIALSGYIEPQARELSKEAGVDYHLAKPLEPHILNNILVEFAQKKALSLPTVMED